MFRRPTRRERHARWRNTPDRLLYVEQAPASVGLFTAQNRYDLVLLAAQPVCLACPRAARGLVPRPWETDDECLPALLAAGLVAHGPMRGLERPGTVWT